MPTELHYGAWLPPDLSVHGPGVDNIIDVLHVFMVLLFVAWGIFFVYCLMRFRRREGGSASYHPVKGKVSKYGEIGVAIFEAVLLIGFSMPVWAEYKNDPPPEDERFEIHVIAQQFQWNTHYPGKDGKFGRIDTALISPSNPIGLDETGDPAAADDIVTVNDIHLPVGRPIYVRLTSMDVIHSFAIPTMRVKQDVIPGMEVPIWFEIQEWAVTDLLKEKMTAAVPIQRARWDKLRHHVAAEDIKAADGEVLIPQGGDLGATYQDGKEMIQRLAEAGVTELVMQPRNPLQVVCAQLCGNSHFKMVANLTTHDAAGFEAWQKKQKEEPDFEDLGF